MRHLLTLSIFVVLITSHASALERVSVDSAGNQLPADGSGEFSISDDGRFVVFATITGIASEDTNGKGDIYLRDRVAGTTTLISVNLEGDAGNDVSYGPIISNDGSAVLFQSTATDLVEDEITDSQLFHHNFSTGTTSLVSVNSDGVSGRVYRSYDISGDDTVVVFSSYNSGLVSGPGDEDEVFLATVGDPASLERISEDPATGTSYGSGSEAAITADGRYAIFAADGSDVIPGAPNEVFFFRRDLQTDEMILASKTTTGGYPNNECENGSISDDGRYVVFESKADNIHPEATESRDHVYIYDAVEDTTEIISRNSAGEIADGDTGSRKSSISANGNFVAFQSESHNLASVPDGAPGSDNTRNVYLRNLATGATEILSINNSRDATGDNNSYDASISADGNHVVFRSSASDLVANDTNGGSDVFVWSRPVPAVATPNNAAAKTKLLKKIRKLKKKMKAAKRKKQVAKLKRFKAKAKKLKKRIRLL